MIGSPSPLKLLHKVPALPFGRRTVRRSQVEPRGTSQLTQTERRTRTLKGDKPEGVIYINRDFTLTNTSQLHLGTFIPSWYLWSWECAANHRPVWAPRQSSWHRGWPPLGTYQCFSCSGFSYCQTSWTPKKKKKKIPDLLFK